MHERSLPASPNWYCSRCSDVNSSGLLGVGAKNTIYLIDVSASSCRVTGECVVTAGHAGGHSGTYPSASVRLKLMLNAGKKSCFCPNQGGQIISGVMISLQLLESCTKR